MRSNSRRRLGKLALGVASRKYLFGGFFAAREESTQYIAPFDVQPGVQSGIRFGECVFPLCEIAESFPEGSLSANFPGGHCAPRCTLRKCRRYT